MVRAAPAAAVEVRTEAIVAGEPSVLAEADRRWGAESVTELWYGLAGSVMASTHG
jgi:hypothetical protein